MTIQLEYNSNRISKFSTTNTAKKNENPEKNMIKYFLFFFNGTILFYFTFERTAL